MSQVPSDRSGTSARPGLRQDGDGAVETMETHLQATVFPKQVIVEAVEAYQKKLSLSRFHPSPHVRAYKIPYM